MAEKKMDLEFRTQLIAFLRACGCPDERLFALLRGVFFRGLRVRLVGSVARVLRGKKMSEFGHLRLRAILQSLGEYYAAVRVDGGVWSGCVKCDAVKRAGKGGECLCPSTGTPWAASRTASTVTW